MAVRGILISVEAKCLRLHESMQGVEI